MRNKYQTCGAILLLVTFATALAGFVWIPWVLLCTVGLIDLYLIYIRKETTITKWVRSLWGRRIDNIVMLSLIGLIWWLKGEGIALWFLLGLLNNHLFERAN